MSIRKNENKLTTLIAGYSDQPATIRMAKLKPKA